MRIFGLGLALALLSQTAAADTMRCGDRLVSNGAPAVLVLELCGTPDTRERWHEHRYLHDVGHVADDTEQWTYNFGASQLLRILQFRRGRLVSIETAGYGYRPAPASAGEFDD
jgi:hypothetical protein